MAALQYTLAELAESLGGLKCQGDSDCVVTTLGSIQDATSGQLAFLDNKKYRQYLATTKASIVILSPQELEHYSGNALITEKPYVAYAKAAILFDNQPDITEGIHPSAAISKNCQIHASAKIGAHSTIGDDVVIEENVEILSGVTLAANCHIAAGTRLYSGVHLYHGVKIGKNCTIHSGAIIGSDGFGMANDNGRWIKVPQLGSVSIADDVEIGANTTIDRGALNDTIIEEGVKIDNLVQIAHNVKIGAHTAIAGCVGIAGSATIGRYCILAGGACINGHISIADRTTVTATAAVYRSITEPGGVWSSGVPAHPYKVWKKNVLAMLHLGELTKKIKKFEKIIKQHLDD